MSNAEDHDELQDLQNLDDVTHEDIQQFASIDLDQFMEIKTENLADDIVFDTQPNANDLKMGRPPSTIFEKTVTYKSSSTQINQHDTNHIETEIKSETNESAVENACTCIDQEDDCVSNKEDGYKKSHVWEIVANGSSRAKAKLFNSKGYSFGCRFTKKGIFWRCSVRNKDTNCKCTVFQKKGSSHFEQKGEHNHPPEIGAKERTRIKARIKETALSDLTISAADVVRCVLNEELGSNSFVAEKWNIATLTRFANKCRYEMADENSNSDTNAHKSKYNRVEKIKSVSNEAIPHKTFSCEVCSKSFCKSYKLETHMLSHTKPFLCDICSRQFRSASSLKKHLKSHSNKKDMTSDIYEYINMMQHESHESKVKSEANFQSIAPDLEIENDQSSDTQINQLDTNHHTETVIKSENNDSPIENVCFDQENEDFILDNKDGHEKSHVWEIVANGSSRAKAKLFNSKGYSFGGRFTKKGIFWRCAVRNKDINCKCTVFQKKGSSHFEQKGEHNHPPEIGAKERTRIKARIKETALSDLTISAADVVRYVLNEELGSNSFVAEKWNIATLTRFANKCRYKNLCSDTNGHELKYDTDDKTFTCQVCSRSFNGVSHLKSHLLDHTSINHYLCDLCGKDFKRDSTFRKHLILCNASEAQHDDEAIHQNNSLVWEIVEKASSRGKPKLFNSDGFSFSVSTNVNIKGVLWRCTVRNNTTYCNCTVLQKEGNHFEQRGRHNHPPEIGALEKAKITARATNFALRSPTLSTPAIVKHVIEDSEKSFPVSNVNPDTLVRKINHAKQYIRTKSNGESCTQADIVDTLGDVEPSEKVFNCDICTKTFNTAETLEIHKSVEHRQNYLCDICGQQFSQARLNKHMSRHYKKDINQCDIYEYIKMTPQDDHELEGPGIHDNSEANLQNNGLVWEIVDKASTRANPKLFNSEGYSFCGRVVENGILWRCTVRNKDNYCNCTVFQKKRSSVFEQRGIHNHPPKNGALETAKLDSRFRQFKSSDPNNMKSIEKLFKCDVCDKSFLRSQNLKTHMLTHTKPFLCDVCSRRFSTAAGLKEHNMRLHSNEYDIYSYIKLPPQEDHESNKSVSNDNDHSELNLQNDEPMWEIVDKASAKAKPKLFNSDGHSFGAHIRGNSVIWRCTVRNNLYNCKCKVFQKKGSSHFVQKGEHNHPPKIGALEKAKLKFRVKELALSDFTLSTPAVVRHVIEEELGEKSSIMGNLKTGTLIRGINHLRQQKRNEKMI